MAPECYLRSVGFAFLLPASEINVSILALCNFIIEKSSKDHFASIASPCTTCLAYMFCKFTYCSVLKLTGFHVSIFYVFHSYNLKVFSPIGYIKHWFSIKFATCWQPSLLLTISSSFPAGYMVGGYLCAFSVGRTVWLIVANELGAEVICFPARGSIQMLVIDPGGLLFPPVVLWTETLEGTALPACIPVWS